MELQVGHERVRLSRYMRVIVCALEVYMNEHNYALAVIQSSQKTTETLNRNLGNKVLYCTAGLNHGPGRGGRPVQDGLARGML